jgi:hypothetical protein
MPSNVIRAMRFDPVRRVLEIAFQGARGLYRYFDVPMEEWRRFRAAAAKGEYLNSVFKRHAFRYERAEKPLPAAHDGQSEQWGDLLAFPRPKPAVAQPQLRLDDKKESVPDGRVLFPWDEAA